MILGTELIALSRALVEPSFDLPQLLDICYEGVLYQAVHRNPACFWGMLLLILIFGIQDGFLALTLL